MRHSNGLKWINTFSEIKKQFLLNLLVFYLQIGTDATTIDTRKMKFSYNRFLHSDLQRAYNLPIILQRLVSITWALCFDVHNVKTRYVIYQLFVLYIHTDTVSPNDRIK